MKRLNVGLVVRARPNKKNECPIFVRITKNGQRAEFSTGQYINPEHWCKDTQKVKAKKDKALNAINEYIEISKVKLLEINMELSVSGQEFSVIDIRNAFLGKDKKPHTLINVLDKYIIQCEK